MLLVRMPGTSVWRRVLATTDVATLEGWLRRAVVAGSVGEVLAGD